jgi:hypothetical protein
MASKRNIFGNEPWPALAFFQKNAEVLAKYEDGKIPHGDLLAHLWYNCGCISETIDDAVSWYSRLSYLVPSEHSVDPYVPSATVMNYMVGGEKIKAIKAIRDETGMSLKDAKGIADEIEKRL